ncbi:hypothetical protein MNY66_16540 (plasmid) [Moellerella wisconsensis]|uniref:Uncharacterized protein n=1 Tax=Moellerella wisconsensis TaxID=158849 RepID=A0ACD3YC68_9GAMM|nr:MULTISPECIES: hypothetical protein [Morganellaceae]QCJ72232.1 hypothetical protein C9446_20745 [Providencia heimbachae]UNH40651.1 hypothetical protein MNY70_17590 [Moellerella wisconsensis]UNH44355.1 hypothetical protein MNY66_16540 [Moellerella wisconsensis]
MASEEIREVTRIGRADGQWGCKCPHCDRSMFFSEDTIEEVRGSQYQHTARLSIISEQRCNGWLEVSTTAKYSRIMFDQGEE